MLRFVTGLGYVQDRLRREKGGNMRSPVRLKLAAAIRAGLDEMSEHWVEFLKANEIGPETRRSFDEEVKHARIGLEVLANLLEGAEYSGYENVIRRLAHDWVNRAGSFSDLLTIERVFPEFALSHLEIDPEGAEADDIKGSIVEFLHTDARARFLLDYLLVYEDIISAESSHTAYVLAHFDALLALTAHLNAAGTREEILEGLALAIRDLFDNIAAVAVFAETADGLQMKSVSFEDDAETEEDVSEEVLGALVELYEVGQVARIDETKLPDWLRSVGASACYAVPVRPREADGVLALLALEGDDSGSIGLPLARIAASECALALDRAEGRARVSRVNRRVRDILSLTRESGWGTGYREAGELVLDYLTDLTSARTALLLAPPPGGSTSDTLRPLASRDVDKEHINAYDAGILPAVVRLVLKSGKTLMIPEADVESALGNREPPPGFAPSSSEALGILPLERRGTPLGVCLFLCLQGNATEPESRSILEIFAGAAADCLATAREYERSLRTARIEQADAQRARVFQQQLTPGFVRSGNTVLWAHLQPAGELAGDILMARAPSEGRMTIWAADVAGRGISAAWSMMFLRQLLAEVPPDVSSPPEVLRRINAELHSIDSREMSTGLFATLMGLSLDEKSQAAHCARAGAPKLFHLDSQGAIKAWAPDGLALGLTRETEFEEAEIPFGPGDKLVWASDGLINAADSSGRRWGEGGLTDSILSGAPLPARALYERILSALGEFATDEEPYDDRSLIVVGFDMPSDWTGRRSGGDRALLLEEALGFLAQSLTPDGRDFAALRLLLDEAIKNAYEHGNKLDDETLIGAEITLGKDHVHLRVHDEGGRLSERATSVPLRNETLLEDKGRGFLLMRHHADHLWVEDDRGLNAVRLLEKVG